MPRKVVGVFSRANVCVAGPAGRFVGINAYTIQDLIASDNSSNKMFEAVIAGSAAL